MNFARYIAGAWLMLQVYFAGGITLPLFRGLDKVAAGEAVSILFPPYYAWNYAMGGAFLVALLFGRGGLRWALAALGCGVAALVIVAATQFGIAPELRALREAGDQAGFSALHRVSMVLNFVGMAFVLAAGWVFRPRRSAA